MTYSDKDINYIKGFDHGCDYIVAEIERHAKQYKEKEICFAFLELLAHLKMEDKPEVRENT